VTPTTKNRIARFVLTFLALAVWIPPVSACPLCESETGQQVREGIFNDDFGVNLLVTLLPFPVLIAIVVLLHYGLPWGCGGRVGRTSSDSTGTDHGPGG
jgi:hypothetical protein